MAINFIRVSPTGFAPSTQVPLEYDNELVMDLCDAITSYEHDNNDDLYFWNILNATYVQLDRQNAPHALMEHLKLYGISYLYGIRRSRQRDDTHKEISL